MRRLAPLVVVWACARPGADAGDAAPPRRPPVDAAVSDEETLGRELVPRPLGLPAVADFNYERGPGRDDFRRAEASYRAGNWPGVQAASEAALARDPGHLAAHSMLASALSRQGKLDGVAAHMAVALAGDWMRWGPGLERDPDLAAYLASPRGPALRAYRDALGEELARRVRGGLLVVARRDPAGGPARPGTAAAPSHAELFAYDWDTARYLRVTRTGSTLAGFLLAPTGAELAYVAYERVDAPDGDGPRLLDARVGRLDLAALAAPAPEAPLAPARAFALAWRGADLLVTAWQGDGRWAQVKPAVLRVAGGAATPDSGAAPTGPALTIDSDGVSMDAPGVAGVDADWLPPRAAAAAFRLGGTRRTVVVPGGERVLRASLAWSPGGARLLAATVGDPCGPAAARESSLLIVEAATGRVRELRRGSAERAARWITDDLVALEDDEGAIRLRELDGRDRVVLRAPGGLALLGVGALAAPPCRAAAPASAPATPRPE